MSDGSSLWIQSFTTMSKRRRSQTCQQQVTVIKRRRTCRQQMTMIRTKTLKAEVRNWLDLPRDVMLLIFTKLGVIEILLNAQEVCSYWRKLAKEPCLFHSIDFRDPEKHFCFAHQFRKLAKEAVDRSCGQLVKLSCTDMTNEAVLHYAINRSNLLISLRIGNGAAVSNCGLIEIAGRLPYLEELDLSSDFYPGGFIPELGRCCPKLKYLRLRYTRQWPSYVDEACAIAKSMPPQLLRLHIIGCEVTNNGLQAILDGCPHLEYLDLRHCIGVELEQDLLKKCRSRIRNTSLPGAPNGSKFSYVDYEVKIYCDMPYLSECSSSEIGK